MRAGSVLFSAESSAPKTVLGIEEACSQYLLNERVKWKRNFSDIDDEDKDDTLMLYVCYLINHHYNPKRQCCFFLC